MNEQRITERPSWIDPRGQVMKTPDDVAEMLRLRGCGWGVKRIARHLGCSHHTVKGYVAAGGAKPFKSPRRPKRLAAPGVRHQSTREEADRRSLRLGKDGRWAHQDKAARHKAQRVQVHLHDGRIQSDPHAETAGGYVRRRSAEGRSRSRSRPKRPHLNRS
jgi:hypothetical protein